MGYNQYTKAAKTGVPYVVSEATREKLRQSTKRRMADSETKRLMAEKISQTVLKKAANGDWHTSLAKKMHHSYKGIDLHGKWELRLAQYFDDNAIQWERCKERFSYEFEGKIRTYVPDFFLPQTQEYVEVKGYLTEKDRAKWSQFPQNLKHRVYVKTDLDALGIDTRSWV